MLRRYHAYRLPIEGEPSYLPEYVGLVTLDNGDIVKAQTKANYLWGPNSTFVVETRLTDAELRRWARHYREKRADAGANGAKAP